MKVAVTWGAGEPFEVRDDARRRAPGPTEVVVRIRAAGICQTDLSLSRGLFGQAMPVVLGHEGAGEVLEVGDAVRSCAPGDHVVLTWVPVCGRCFHCVRGETYLCASRRRASERGDAGEDLVVGDAPVHVGLGTATFSEEVVVGADGIVPLPRDLPFAEAALLGCAVPTGYGAAVNSGGVGVGDQVRVVGCGAIGLSAVQGARIAGAAMIVAIDPHPDRRRRAVELGADAAYAPEEEPSGPDHGYDVGIDAVGHSSTIRASWDAVRRGGTVVVVGAGKADDEIAFSALELFHDEKTLRGSFYGSSDMRREVPRMVDLWRSGRLRLAELIDDTVELDAINEAVARQSAGEALRVVVTP